MCLWRVAVFLPFLLRFCWFGFGAVLILHFHELIHLFLVEVLTEIPLPFGNLNLQTPRSLHFLSIALVRSYSFVLLLLAQAFLPRMSI